MKDARLRLKVLLFVLWAGVPLLLTSIEAQGRGGAAADAPRTAKVVAPVDFTGYWVSIISEDWRWRMVTPPRGDYFAAFGGLNPPLTQEGRRVADNWDPARDVATGNQCKAYGAPGVMRMPGRLHITWEDDNTLRIDTDTGQQTRLLHFSQVQQARGERTWQGYSAAVWEFVGGPGQGKGGGLKVVTAQMRAGYLRTNGVPYSENAVLTEYFDRHADAGADLILHTRIVEDAQYLTEPYVVTSHFKREPDGSKWNPTPCESHYGPKVIGPPPELRR